MENTNTIQFPSDQPEWFIAQGESFRGPFKAEEIYRKLKENEISWIEYLYREQDGRWIRAADHPVFQPLQSAPPKPKPMMAPPPPPVVEDTKWFLYQKDTQTGPYSSVEMKRLIQAGQIVEGAFVWQEKFSEWKLCAEVMELKSVPVAPPLPMQSQPTTATHPTAVNLTAPKSNEKRAFPRKPLVAQVYATNQKTLITGICRDISVGGMQVLTDHLPGPMGTSIRLNVMPPSDSGITSFVAEGVVVRILEDERGFSFRFSDLEASARVAIERYIS